MKNIPFFKTLFYIQTEARYDVLKVFNGDCRQNTCSEIDMYQGSTALLEKEFVGQVVTFSWQTDGSTNKYDMDAYVDF